MLISLLTPTGGRKKIFELCEHWIKNQTIHNNAKYKIEWICVDDYPEDPTKFTLGQTVIKAPILWKPGYNTQRSNCTALLEAAKGDLIFWIEDDDWYSSTYIESMVKLLETSQIAGLSYSRYYHIGIKGYNILTNYKHASLCQTAFRKSLTSRCYRAINSGHFYFDIELWKSCMQDGISSTLLAHTNLSIGIKGSPTGKQGLSNGHNPENYKEDTDLNVLKGWIEKDYKYYLPFVK